MPVCNQCDPRRHRFEGAPHTSINRRVQALLGTGGGKYSQTIFRIFILLIKLVFGDLVPGSHPSDPESNVGVACADAREWKKRSDDVVEADAGPTLRLGGTEGPGQNV